MPELSMKGLALLRGEILAANLLATAALRSALATNENKQEIFDAMYEYIERTLNMSGPATGNQSDKLTTQMLETARFQAMQQLDAIEQIVRMTR